MTANATKTTNTETAPAVDVEVVSTGSTTDSEAPANDDGETNAEGDAEDPTEEPTEEPAKAPDKAPEVKTEPAKGKADKLTAKEQLNKQRTKKLEQIKADHSQALESSGHYNDWGFVYAAPAPIANAIGGEIGFMQRNDETMTVQRTGIGIYLRSDHIFDAKLDACTERF